MDNFQKWVIDDSIERLEKLLASGVLIAENWRKPIFRSTFLDVIVTLRNLLAKMDDLKLRIDFDDSVIKSERNVVKSEKVEDVTDLVRFIRNALCHPNSPNNFYTQSEKGKVMIFFNISDEKDGDLCFWFGRQKIFLRKHIVRAFEEAKDKLGYVKPKTPQELLDSLKRSEN